MKMTPISFRASAEQHAAHAGSPQEHPPVLHSSPPKQVELIGAQVRQEYAMPESPKRALPGRVVPAKRMFPGGANRVPFVEQPLPGAVESPSARVLRAPVSHPVPQAQAVPVRRVTDPAQDFQKQLRRIVTEIRENKKRLAIEPVNSVVLDRQTSASLRLIALYRSWIEEAKKRLVTQASPEVARLVQKAIQLGEDNKWADALIANTSALLIEPASAHALKGLIGCAEKISAQSMQQRAAVPPELRALQRRLEERTMLVEALTREPVGHEEAA